MVKNEKKIPKSVWLFVVLMGFLAGNAIGGLLFMMNNVLAWAIINLVTVVTLFFLDWRYGEILEHYIPRYKTEEKEESP